MELNVGDVAVKGKLQISSLRFAYNLYKNYHVSGFLGCCKHFSNGLQSQLTFVLDSLSLIS